MTYKTEGNGNERFIIFTKIPVEGYTPKKRRGRPRGKLPFQIALEAVAHKPKKSSKSTNQQYQEAMAWIKNIPGFHPGNLKNIQKLPPEDVALAYPYIRSKYTEGEKKSPGWIYDAFTKKWHLRKAIKQRESDRRIQEKQALLKSIFKEKEQTNLYWKSVDIQNKIQDIIQKDGSLFLQLCGIVQATSESILIRVDKLSDAKIKQAILFEER